MNLLLFPMLAGCSLFYDYEVVNSIGIGYSKTENRGFIAEIDWNQGDSMNIILPSTYENIPIKELGGYFGRGVPSPFAINPSIDDIFQNADYYYGTSENYLYDDLGYWDECEIYNYNFVITLPDYLDKITFVDKSIEVAEFNLEDGTVLAKIFRSTFYFNLTTTNKNFYTNDGYLYDNEGILIDDFVYYNNN